MTQLATDPLTLGHTAISLAAIVTGLIVLAAMLKGQTPVALTGFFLTLTVLTSVSGFLFHNSRITPGQVVGGISLVILVVALFALYGRHLAGRWRNVYVIAAVAALYLNVFVLVIQSFIKVPALHALVPTIPPTGPVFGGVQAVMLMAFILAAWLAIRAGRPTA